MGRVLLGTINKQDAPLNPEVKDHCAKDITARPNPRKTRPVV